MTAAVIKGFRLSPQQLYLWRAQPAGGESPYFVRCSVAVEGDLDRGRLARALKAAAGRHEIFRTAFRQPSSMKVPLQVVSDECAVPLDFQDLSALTTAERERRLEELSGGARLRFDYAEDSPLRASLVRLSERGHLLLLTLPALCADTASLRNLVADVSRFYETGETAADADEVMQYADCAEILNELVESAQESPGRDYWRGKLDDAPPAPDLPLERASRGSEDFTPATLPVGLDASLARELQAQAQRQGVSLPALLLACWQSLLARLTGQSRLFVGVAFDGRTDEQLEEAVGLFVRYLPAEGDAAADLRLADLAGRLDRELSEMAEWQDYFAWRSDATADAEPPFFPFCFRFDGDEAARSGRELTFRIVEEYECVSRFKVKLTCRQRGETLAAALQYDSALYGREAVALLAEQYRVVLAGAAQSPEMPLGESEFIGEDERRRVLFEFNDTAEEFAQEKLLHRPFEEQAARTPGRVALLFEDERLTYAELNAAANQLAHRLRALGVGPDMPVGICLERSTGMVVALLGILKAGGAYLPLDPQYPKERLSHVLADARPTVVVTTERLRAALPEYEARVVRLDADREALAAESPENPEPGGLTPAHLAYVLYTSGSTGQPKGVLIPHEAIINHMLWMQSALPLTEEDRVLQKTPFTFDASVWEFFLPLMSGAQLIVAVPGGHQDSAYLVRTINEQGVTIFQLVPSMLRNFLEERDVAACRSLRRVFCGGEALAYDLVERFFDLLDAELYNFYGPTEVSIDATIWPCRREDGDGGGAVVPIGRPLSNVRTYVLDRRLRPAPLGVAGELYVGGVQLARGYMRRPDLTAEKFIPDPFSVEPGARLYRTGDLCRFTEDGHIEYLGRIDHQVKVRGFRIELGEIEAVLLRHPAARDAVVAVREDVPGDKRLVAYFVADDDAPATADELRRHLKGELPDYMIPSAFVQLTAIPLTPNGKVDRRALPAPEGGGRAGDTYVAPRTAAEEIVAGIWSEVLGVEHVGVEDNFFDAGGHSLLVTQVVSRVREAFAVELPLRSFFDAPTLADLAANIEAEMKSARGLNARPLVPAPRDGALPLSFAQQRLWFLNQLDPDSALYSIPTLVRLTGALDVDALGQTFEEILRRHESLRTTFSAVDGLPAQIISDTFEPPLRFLDLGGVPEAEREAEALRLAKADLLRPFDLARGPLVRLLLLRLDPEQHILLCTIHHIVSDIWSRDVLIREVRELYSARVHGVPASLPRLPVQYADYAVWERESWRGDVLKTELAYWKKQLDGAPMMLSLPTDYPRPPVQSVRGAKEGVPLPLSLLEGLRSLSRREGVTMYMTLLAALNVVLLRYTGREDILVGTAISNRDRLEIEGLIGFFTNTLVIRTDLSGNPTFSDLLKRVREVALGAYAHRDLPFDMLVEELQPERDMSYAPVFQVIFAHQLAPKENLELPGLGLERVEIGNDTSKYDLNVNIVERPDSLSLWIEYSPDLFEAATIKRMLGHFQTLLHHVVDKPDERLLQLPLLSEEERRYVVHDWNDTAADYPRERCAHELFEEQAARTPEAVAVAHGGAKLTYGELNARANRLARHLRRLGVGAETLVGVMVERTPEMVVALLGILKAGGAYLPLDPDLPKDRLAFMLRDAGVRLLLARRRLLTLVPGYANDIFCIEDEARQCAGYEPEDLPAVSAPENLAYVIYTSGSTGRPKGVTVPHSGLVNYLSWAARAYDAGAGSPVHSPLGFDLTVTSLWVPLVAGGTVELLEDRPGVEALAEALSRGGEYGLVKLTPAHLDVLGQLLGEGGGGAGTRSLVVGGEALRGESLRWWREHARGVRVVNEYGPTEAVVGCCVYEAEAGELGAGAVPIGRPIANTRLFVLDERLELTPVGLAGELYVGGEGVTRGYLRRPGLTAERFIPDAYSGAGGSRLYRTGDVVRLLADGNLEYLGRGDRQVKLRGYRVELGEVEAALLGHEGVREAVAVVREEAGGERRLVAYVVGEAAGGEETAGRWREYLRERVPEYMVPSAFVVLDSLPLTPNGKVDRRALLELEPTHHAGEYVGPRTAAEEVVAGICAEVLKTGRVGVRENFFALGGHSLLAMQVISRVREVFGVEVALRSVFEHPTVEGLAREIDKAVRAERGTLPPPIGRAPRNGPLPVSFVQERIWQMAQREGRPSVYNLDARLEGPLDVPALERSLDEVVRRNEALRTTFQAVEGRPFQVINPHRPVSLTLVDLSHLPEAERDARARQLAAEQGQKPFDLTQGRLLRFTLVRLAEQSHLLLFTVPHAICDHTSVKLLAAEVGAVYAAFSQGQPTPLPELDIQYADYASWERQWLQGEVYETQVAYWRRQLAGCPPALQLPTDRPRPPVKTYRGAQLHFSLPEELSDAVGTTARRERSTVFMVLLAAFKSLLHRYTGESDMIVGTSVAGRTTHTGIERLIGNFGTPLALRTRPSGDTTYRELLRQVREVTLEAYAHQDLTFDRVLDELKPERDPSYMPLIQVGFVVHSLLPEQAVPLGELSMEVSNVHSGRSLYDLSLRMHQTPQGLVGAFEYNTDLFERATVERMVEHFRVLLEGVVADPGQRIADLPLLTEVERDRLLTQWGRSAENFPEEFALRELAERLGARVLYVLDADLNLLPAGVPGEICLGDLSAPQDLHDSAEGEFAGDPFGVAPGARLYRTGLRARFLPDGGVELLGRTDQHVKVRGFKVDVSQIDAALNEHPGVLQSVTRLSEATADAPPQLATYVVSRQPEAPEPEALRDFLKTRLPAYMLPSAFVMVEEPPGRQAVEHNECLRD